MHLNFLILAGGSGQRMWPVSNDAVPKQFHKFHDDQTLFQKTLDRAFRASPDNLYISCNQKYLSLAWSQSRYPIKFISEQKGRNTGAAIILSTLLIDGEYPDSTIVVTPSDHEIGDDELFQQVIVKATGLAQNGDFVLLGVPTTRAEMDFGYIEFAECEDEFYKVKKFIEKPAQNDAMRFHHSRNHYWNSGIFIFKTSTLINYLAEFEPELFALAQKITQCSIHTMEAHHLNHTLLELFPEISFDKLVMEKAKNIIGLEATFSWHDVGSWQRLWGSLDKDKEGNVISDNTFTYGTKNSYIKSGTGKKIAAIGLDNISIIETENAILVANNNHSEYVKMLAKQAVANDNPEIKKISIEPHSKTDISALERGHIICMGGTIHIMQNGVIIYPNEHLHLPRGIYTLSNNEDKPAAALYVQAV